MFPSKSGCMKVDYDLSFVILFNIFGIYLSIMPLPTCSLGHIYNGINGMTWYDTFPSFKDVLDFLSSSSFSSLVFLSQFSRFYWRQKGKASPPVLLSSGVFSPHVVPVIKLSHPQWSEHGVRLRTDFEIRFADDPTFWMRYHLLDLLLLVPWPLLFGCEDK